MSDDKSHYDNLVKTFDLCMFFEYKDDRLETTQWTSKFLKIAQEEFSKSVLRPLKTNSSTEEMDDLVNFYLGGR